MTKFEKYLIENGYVKYILNYKTMKYEVSNSHVISTMSNIDHRYIHSEDKANEICFGLSEAGKPPTLISPRPKIIVIRENMVEDERFDDSMNLVLNRESPKDILNALFDETVLFKYDLTI